jgi:hypothetical protein
MKVRNAKPKDKAYRLFDGGGLYLDVTPHGSKLWRLKYHFGGKEKRLALGVYPAGSLSDARLRREQAKKLIENDSDPGEEKKARKEAVKAAEHAAALTFETVAEQWFEKHKAGTTPSTQEKTRMFLDALAEYVGQKSFCAWERKTLVDAVQALQDEKSVHFAHRTAGVLNRICMKTYI